MFASSFSKEILSDVSSSREETKTPLDAILREPTIKNIGDSQGVSDIHTKTGLKPVFQWITHNLFHPEVWRRSSDADRAIFPLWSAGKKSGSVHRVMKVIYVF